MQVKAPGREPSHVRVQQSSKAIGADCGLEFPGRPLVTRPVGKGPWHQALCQTVERTSGNFAGSHQGQIHSAWSGRRSQQHHNICTPCDECAARANTDGWESGCEAAAFKPCFAGSSLEGPRGSVCDWPSLRRLQSPRCCSRMSLRRSQGRIGSKSEASATLERLRFGRRGRGTAGRSACGAAAAWEHGCLRQYCQPCPERRRQSRQRKAALSPNQLVA